MEPILNMMFEYANSVLNTEVAKMTVAFLIAARLHRRWVKKDVMQQVKGITDAIDNLSESMKQTITNESKRIDELSTRVDNLEHNKN